MLSTLDPLLRGEYTSPAALEPGAEAPPVRNILRAAGLLGALYGASMGLFALTTKGALVGLLQMFASAGKVPLLVMATVVITFPSLCAFSALARSRLDIAATLRLVLFACATHLVLLASLAPILAFFTLSTTSYGFMRLLNVALFVAAGAVGLRVLLTSMRPLLATPVVGPPESSVPPEDRPAPARPVLPEGLVAPEGDDPEEAASEPPPRAQFANRRSSSDGRSLVVLRGWVLLFALVGAQMGWILRPLIGAPDEPFVLFSERGGSFITGLIESLTFTFGQ